MIETSEPITSFLGSHSEADAVELGRRVREGRIQIGGLQYRQHGANELGTDGATLLSGARHTPDLLGVAPGKTAQIDDVIGLTWPLATYIEGGRRVLFFHGHNGCLQCLRPLGLSPCFIGMGRTARAQVLVRSIAYGGYEGDNLGDASEAQISVHQDAGRHHPWPYDSLLLQDGTDFRLVTIDNAVKIHEWNARYATPA